ncbi:hypothetical protein F2Q70_00032786 [Brassica cretica]|uniref:Uncharacterized protein n=1 Tax=Brassica cretica TaxID=69181 RepID=A0A8S9FL94_BRACR|nr:hypothetical protein F2Q70_00032786 [Brassica cretica]
MPDSFTSEVTRFEHFSCSSHDGQSLKAMEAPVPKFHNLLPSQMPYGHLTMSPQDKGKSISFNSYWHALTIFMRLQKPSISMGRQSTISSTNLRFPKLQINSSLNLSFLDKFFKNSSRQGRERSSSTSSFSRERYFSSQSLFVRGDTLPVFKTDFKVQCVSFIDCIASGSFDISHNLLSNCYKFVSLSLYYVVSSVLEIAFLVAHRGLYDVAINRVIA